MSSPPEFGRWYLADVKQYGMHEAVVLERIRWRCDGPDHFEADGARWWQISLTAFGNEVGLSKRQVERALDRLGSAVMVKRLANKSRAYRASTERCSTPMPQHQTVPTTAPNGADDSTKRCHVPIPETLETRGDAEVEQVRPGALAVVPGLANGEPQQFCNEHMPHGTAEDCLDCWKRYRVHKRWKDAAQARREHERRAASRPQWKCPRCRDTDIVLNSDGRPVRGPCVCHHDTTWHKMTDAERAQFASVLRRLTAKDGLDDERGTA